MRAACVLAGPEIEPGGVRYSSTASTLAGEGVRSDCQECKARENEGLQMIDSGVSVTSFNLYHISPDEPP